MAATLKIEKLSDSNYFTWKRQMKALLVEKGYWTAISAPPAQPWSAEAAEIDLKATSQLIMNVSNLYMHLIAEDATAAQAWLALEEAFHPKITSHTLQLRRQMTTAKMEPKESVSAYYGRLVVLRQALASSGVQLSDADMTTYFLNGLPAHFDNIVDIIAMQENLSFSAMLGYLQNTENKLNMRQETTAPRAPTHPKDPAKAYNVHQGKTCYFCKKKGHIAAECRKKQGNNKKGGDKGTCGYCGKGNHTEEECHSRLRAEAKQREGKVAFAFSVRGVDPKYTNPKYDSEDFQLEQELYYDLDDEYGPFDLDAAADTKGNNAFCTDFRSKDNDFCESDVRGRAIWCNPPFKSAGKFIAHYLEQKQQEPYTTSACFVLPVRPDAPWWSLLKNMKRVRMWKAGTQLFTMPPKQPGEPRRRKEPCPFDVAVFYDGPTTLQKPQGTSHAVQEQKPAIIIDSGASHHMTPSKDYLCNMRKTPVHLPSTVTVASGQRVPVRGIGDLIIRADTDDDGKQVTTFSDVLYVPDLNVTLLSLSAILSRDGVATFCGNECYIAKKTSSKPALKACMEDDRHSRLFVVQGASVIGSDGRAYNVDTNFSTKLWHRRMGHLGYRNLAELTKQAEGINVKAQDFNHEAAYPSPCGDCMAGRQARLPRPESETPRSTVPLHRLSADLCGPMPEESLSGNKYYLIVIDEATRFSVLQPIAQKKEAAGHLLRIMKQLETITGKKVVNLRTDQGGEFVNNDLHRQLDELGIVHETTPGYSPESNGAAERANRTIMEKVRSMLNWSQLPNTFWAECAVMANLLRNVSPVSGATKTPWELLYGQKPDLSTLRVFGCLAYVFTPKERRTKLDPKSTPGIIVGYDLRAKTYRVYREDRIYEERDVIADETKTGWSVLHDEDDSYVATPNNVRVDPDPEDESSDDDDDHNDRADSNESQEQETETDYQEETDESTELPNAGEEAGRRYPTRARNPTPTYGPFVTHRAEAFTMAGSVTKTPFKDPESLREAKASPQSAEWKQAMEQEMQALISNDTWELVRTPPEANPLPCKWVFKTKLNADGSIERFKARLVAGGHRQHDGIDYFEVYAPVSRFATLRAEFSNGRADMCCKLKKTHYGLKLAPKEWFDVLSAKLNQMRFKQSDNDQALWVRPRTDKTPAVFILLWVDDLLIACLDRETLDTIKKVLLSHFKGRDLGETDRYLNVTITRDRKQKTLKMSSPTHIKTLLGKCNMEDCKGTNIPMTPGADITQLNDNDKPLEPQSPYAEAVGALMYITSTTRPDLCFSVNVLAKHMSKPAERHWLQLKNVLRYLAETKDYGITFGTTKEGLRGYTDSDYASCKDTRKSRGGYVFMLYGGAINWSSKQQSVIATSTAEAEYIAAALAAREAIWLKRVCNDLEINTKSPVPLLADNKASIHMATNSADTARTKHIDVAYHSLRHAIVRLAINMVFCKTDDNAADMFTKALAAEKLKKFSKMIGIN